MKQSRQVIHGHSSIVCGSRNFPYHCFASESSRTICQRWLYITSTFQPLKKGRGRKRACALFLLQEHPRSCVHSFYSHTSVLNLTIQLVILSCKGGWETVFNCINQVETSITTESNKRLETTAVPTTKYREKISLIGAQQKRWTFVWEVEITRLKTDVPPSCALGLHSDCPSLDP